MLSVRNHNNTHNVLVPQEQSYKPAVNPTHANINNLVIPTKFMSPSQYLILAVTGLIFPNISYINNVKPMAIGFINLRKIDNFASIQAQNVFYPIAFGCETDPEKAVSVDITDMYDVKDFERESSAMSLIKFEQGKYPLFNLELDFSN